MKDRGYNAADARMLLSKHELLGRLTGEEQRHLLAPARVERFAPGETLFRRGDPGDRLFVILVGRIMLGTALGPDKLDVANILCAGRVFGEVAFLDGAERLADATALVECQVLVIERRDFVPFLHKHKDAGLHLIAGLCACVRQVSEPESYEVARFSTLPVRLARKLLLLADIYGRPVDAGLRIEMKLSQQDLGRMTETSRESINKVTRAVRRELLVEIEDGYITIRKSALTRIDEGP